MSVEEQIREGSGTCVCAISFQAPSHPRSHLVPDPISSQIRSFGSNSDGQLGHFADKPALVEIRGVLRQLSAGRK